MAASQSIDRAVTEILEESWRVYFENIALFVISSLIHVALSVLTLGIMAGPLTVGFLDQVRRRRAGEAVEVTDIFRGNAQFLPALIAMVLVAVGVGVGLFLFLLPGLYLALFWFSTLVVMAYEGTGALESMARSGRIFKENVWLVVVLAVFSIVINSLGSAVALGVFLTSPFTLVLLAVFYEKVTATPAEMAAPGVAMSPAQVPR